MVFEGSEIVIRGVGSGLGLGGGLVLIDLDINFGALKLGATDASQMNFELSSKWTWGKA